MTVTFPQLKCDWNSDLCLERLPYTLNWHKNILRKQTIINYQCVIDLAIVRVFVMVFRFHFPLLRFSFVWDYIGAPTILPAELVSRFAELSRRIRQGLLSFLFHFPQWNWVNGSLLHTRPLWLANAHCVCVPWLTLCVTDFPWQLLDFVWQLSKTSDTVTAVCIFESLKLI